MAALRLIAGYVDAASIFFWRSQKFGGGNCHEIELRAYPLSFIRQMNRG
jgi:hypothetical protein